MIFYLNSKIKVSIETGEITSILLSSLSGSACRTFFFQSLFIFFIYFPEGAIPAVRPLANTLPSLCQSLELDLRTGRVSPTDPAFTSVIILLLELPMLEILELANILPDLCSLIVCSNSFIFFFIAINRNQCTFSIHFNFR